MLCNVMRLATLLLFDALWVHADEIAFVDVFSGDAINIRSLDVPVSSARGTDNIFLADPMESHDWTSVRRVRASLTAEIQSALDGRGVAAERIRAWEKELEPLYGLLPKNDRGFLANGTTRYALHRLFRKKYGWSVKGFEPAGGAWMKTMSVTFDVKQTSKYLIPTFVHGLILDHFKEEGSSLRSLAILAATLEHLIRAELIGYLHSVHATLGYPTGGFKSETEAEEIVDTFLMVYAFGINLEVSDHGDIRTTKKYLDEHHSGWRRVRQLAHELRREIAGSRNADFAALLRVIVEISSKYASFQHTDCQAAIQHLSQLPGGSEGSIDVDQLKPTEEREGFRPLLKNDVEELGRFGALSEDRTKLLTPNFMSSHLMCLTTASFYTVCCPDQCEDVLAHLESSLGAAVAPSAKLAELLQSFGPKKGEASLAKLAEEQGGKVSIYSRGFATWLHAAFPLKCPSPQEAEARLTRPRTADEWMEENTGEVQDTESLMAEISDMIARYATIGKGENEAAPVLETRTPGPDDVLFLQDSKSPDVSSSPGFSLRPIFYGFAVCSFLAAVYTRGSLGVEATQPRGEKAQRRGGIRDVL